MKRTALLTLLVIALGSGLAAQQSTPPYPDPKPAPKLGHPLDPADVDVLTGKTARRNYVAPYVRISPYGQYDRLGVVTGPRTGGVLVPLGAHALVHRRGHPVFLAPLRKPVFFPVFGPGGIAVIVGPAAHGPPAHRK